jgi:hypothetical protein
MNAITEIVSRILPVLFLLLLGYWIRRSAFLSEEAVGALQKLVVNLALPAVLFTSFLDIELQATTLAVSAIPFAICLLLLGLGFLIKPRVAPAHPYFPLLMTGFEYGMLGISLFGAAYGVEQIGYIAVVDLGHELFIWFVLLAFLLREREGIRDVKVLVGRFLRSPVILAILTGILFNALGARDLLHDFFLTAAVIATFDFLGSLTIPLILIIIGYGIRLNRSGLREAWPVPVLRLVLLIPLALLLNALVLRDLLDLSPYFTTAFFTLLILPPPFIIPLYIDEDLEDEKRYVNNVLTLHTLVSITLFTLYFALNPLP